MKDGAVFFIASYSMHKSLQYFKRILSKIQDFLRPHFTKFVRHRAPVNAQVMRQFFTVKRDRKLCGHAPLIIKEAQQFVPGGPLGQYFDFLIQRQVFIGKQFQHVFDQFGVEGTGGRTCRDDFPVIKKQNLRSRRRLYGHRAVVDTGAGEHLAKDLGNAKLGQNGDVSVYILLDDIYAAGQYQTHEIYGVTGQQNHIVLFIGSRSCRQTGQHALEIAESDAMK